MSLDYADRDAHLERGEYLLEEDHGHYARDTVTLSLSLPHLIHSYLMFIVLTYVYCSLCIQHSECEPLGLFIGHISILGIFYVYIYMSLRPFSRVLLPQIYIHPVYQILYSSYFVTSWSDR